MKLTNKTRLVSFARDSRGLSTVEYVIILCLIAVVCVGVWKTFGETVRAKIDRSTEVMDKLPTTTKK